MMPFVLLLVVGVAFYISLSGVKRRLRDVEHDLQNQQRETEEINRRLQAMKKQLAATMPPRPQPSATAPAAPIPATPASPAHSEPPHTLPRIERDEPPPIPPHITSP